MVIRRRGDDNEDDNGDVDRRRERSEEMNAVRNVRRKGNTKAI